MGGSRRTRCDHLASSLRGQVVVVVGVLLAVLGGSVVLDRSARDDAALPSETTAPPTRSQARAFVQSDPSRILLPQIALSARVIPIAAEGGTLTPPSNPRVVGWWSGGARPGDRIGSAVMTAHTVHTGGGAFDDLDKLRLGTIATVITSTGRISYVVASVTNYPKRSLAKHAAELFDHSTHGRLVLVTCEDWNGEVYLSNTVVIADPVR